MCTIPEIPNKLAESQISSCDDRLPSGVSPRNRLVVGGGLFRGLDTYSRPNEFGGQSMDTDSPMPPSCLRLVAAGFVVGGVALTLLGAVVAQSMR